MYAPSVVYSGRVVFSKSHSALGPDLLGPPPGVGLSGTSASHQAAAPQLSLVQTQQHLQPQTSQSYTQSSASSSSHQQEQTPLRSTNPSGASITTQTPAQQVLASPADRWGLLALLTMIRSIDPDTAMLGMGTDLSLAGFDLGVQECVEIYRAKNAV